MIPCRSHKVTCMERFGVEPESIHSTTESVALMGAQQAAVREVGLPFLQRVDFFPLLGDATDFDRLLKKSVGDRDSTADVCGLGGVLREYLRDGVQGPKFSGGSRREDGETLLVKD